MNPKTHGVKEKAVPGHSTLPVAEGGVKGGAMKPTFIALLAVLVVSAAVAADKKPLYYTIPKGDLDRLNKFEAAEAKAAGNTKPAKVTPESAKLETTSKETKMAKATTPKPTKGPSRYSMRRVPIKKLGGTQVLEALEKAGAKFTPLNPKFEKRPYRINDPIPDEHIKLLKDADTKNLRISQMTEDLDSGARAALPGGASGTPAGPKPVVVDDALAHVAGEKGTAGGVEEAKRLAKVKNARLRASAKRWQKTKWLLSIFTCLSALVVGLSYISWRSRKTPR